KPTIGSTPKSSAFTAIERLASAVVASPVPFPYVPGLLSFREAPPLLEALARLPLIPDCLVVDAHGLAHPRRFGLACHLGVWCDIPTIGIAKSLLVGRHGPLGRARGSIAPLVDRGETVGAAVRTRAGVRPVYVSVGHRFDLSSACALALALAPRFRIVEPIRAAHALVGVG
ncbi:MAG: endonuclease V, partial [Myxococcota bacterium]|nr:endonuclease V [Myxococcota bacterium]